ncbi:MAG: CoA transferase, partial [bacterium]|nr:CoA transferase [bacterium]
EPDRAPLRAGGISAWAYAGIEAAGAALVAHHERVRSGRGQRVDVSALLSTNLAAAFLLLATRTGSGRETRAGGGLRFGPVYSPFIWEAADGFVSLTLMFSGPAAPFFAKFLGWMHEAGSLDAQDTERDWAAALGQVISGQEDASRVTALIERIAEFLRARTKQELLDESTARGLLLVPVSTVADVYGSPQLETRNFWREHEHPELGVALRYPGPFAKPSRTPLKYRHPAPRIGEHNAEILAEPARIPAFSGGRAGAEDAPLAGLKVLDFMWVMAGPHSTRVLADYGATVIKIESASSLDLVRVLPPFYGGVLSPESSASFGSLNAGKRSLCLDLRNQESHPVVHDLVRWADIVCESFSPRAMKKLGFDFESLQAVKPDLIMLSSCLFGQTGPLASLAGYGTMGAAIAGLAQPTGWPDRSPCGPFGPYTDWLAPRLTVPTLLAALDHRRRTGQGQYIDQAQAESALHFMTPALLDYAANGRVIDRVANTDPQMTPHGAWPCAGDDEWVAIAVRDDDDWGRLRRTLGLADDPRLTTLAGRREHADVIDVAITAWTQTLGPAEAEQVLQAAGIPAHAVTHSSGDPQFDGHFIAAPHALRESDEVESSRYRLSRSPAQVKRAGPTMGQDTDFVLAELLGYEPVKIESLRAVGALG